MYLSLVLYLLGWAAYLSNGLALLLVPVFVLYINELQIKPEERALSALLGAEYASYKTRFGGGCEARRSCRTLDSHETSGPRHRKRHEARHQDSNVCGHVQPGLAGQRSLQTGCSTPRA
jgi:hypothetical protein